MENTNNLEYIEAPAKPENFDLDLLKICGTSPNGIDPYLRFVWGNDAVENWGDDKVHRYPDSREPPRFVGMPFWILEGWQSPDVYDRAEWEANRDILGEFPNRGVWDFIEILRSPDGEFVPLGSLALEKAREWRFWKTKPKKRVVAGFPKS